MAKGQGRGSNNPNAAANLKPWKPGQSGNPEGSRLHNPAWRAVQAMTHDDMAALLLFVSHSSLAEVEKAAKSDDTPMLQRCVMNCFVTATKKGDTQALERLLGRMIGNKPTEIVVRNPDGESFRSRQPTAKELLAELEAIEARERARQAAKPPKPPAEAKPGAK